MDFLIIGGGPAGLSAASTLRRVSPESSVTILSNEPHRPYAKMVLPYLLAGVVEEEDLFLRVSEGVNLVLSEEATRIHPGERFVETASGRRWPYDRLLIAPGGVPDRPEIEGCRLPFAFTIRNLPDIRGIRPFISARTNRAVIAGAGPVGMETGDALHRQGMRVTFVVTSNRLFSTMLDVPSAAFLEKKLSDKGIEIRKGEDIVKIEENGTVHFRSGDAMECDLVVFGKGVKPCVGLLADSGIAMNAGIVVNEMQQTNLPGIYAAGDAAETGDLTSGEKRVNALWPEAVEQGHVAALNMAGMQTAYHGSLARNILRVFDVSILVAGMGRAEGPEVRVSEDADHYHKLVLDHGMLKGMICVGEGRNEGLYRELMKRRIDVSPYSSAILKGSFSYPRFQRHAMRL